MAYFAAVAAVRIQSWLARTPDLRYVRGASHALTHETSRESLTQYHVLPTGVESDPETTDVAGVCVLRSDEVARLDEAVRLVADHLQARLPGIEWTAWRAQAESYVEAYGAVHGQAEPGAEVKWWPRRLPLNVHVPFAAACARCSHELAVEEVHIPGDKTEGIGPDCKMRYDAGDDSQFKDFEALAKMGELGLTTGRRDAANHLATVCADGNRVGAFFEAVADLRDPALQARLSNALDAAAQRAADSAAACGPGRAIVAMNHFVGGDDIFASVAAPFAWQYASTLSNVFESTFRRKVTKAFKNVPNSEQSAAVQTAAEAVSLGIGIAFAHAKHPIADCRETALAAEKHAKQATRGQQGAVSWADITVEPSIGLGSHRLPRGRWVAIQRLTQELATPHPALVMPSSARKTLESLLRARSDDTPEAVVRHVRVWATRVGRLDDLASYLPEEKTARTEVERAVDDLRHSVDRARWWPEPAQDSDETPKEER